VAAEVGEDVGCAAWFRGGVEEDWGVQCEGEGFGLGPRRLADEYCLDRSMEREREGRRMYSYPAWVFLRPRRIRDDQNSSGLECGEEVRPCSLLRSG